MTKILEYNEYLNINHPYYHSLQSDDYCFIGEIVDGRWLVLAADWSCKGYNHLVSLEIINKYEHNGIKYRVKKTGWNQYKRTRINQREQQDENFY